MPDAIPDNLVEALRAPQRRRMQHWWEQLQRHRRHQNFALHDYAAQVEYGFTCGGVDCDESDPVDVRLPLRSVREAAEDLRVRFNRFKFHWNNRGKKVAKRAAEKADRRARDLLYRYLTREQKWYFRAHRYVPVLVQLPQYGPVEVQLRFPDASTLRVPRAGAPVQYQFCIHPDATYGVPAADDILAQKVVLESSPEYFFRTMNVRWVEEGKTLRSSTGSFLWDGSEPVLVDQFDHEVQHRINLDVPDAHVDEPRRWVDEFVGGALDDQVVWAC